MSHSQSSDASNPEKLQAALSLLQRRLEALEVRRPLSPEALAAARRQAEEAAVERIRLLETELKTEIHGWVADQLNQLAERLEARPPEPARHEISPSAQIAGEPGDDPPEAAPTEFVGHADRLEGHLEEIERRISGAARAVVELATSPQAGQTRVPSEGAAPGADGSVPEQEPSRADPESVRKDINRIRFEDLRELGLSVTQAARLLARRDAGGGFRSLEQLTDVLDFPRELVDRLQRAVKLG